MKEDKLEQARVRAMALINEDYMFEVLLMAELYCSRILLRLEVIAAQVSCPLDIVEQVYGLCYIAPYLDKVTELIKVSIFFLLLAHPCASDSRPFCCQIWSKYALRRSGM